MIKPTLDDIGVLVACPHCGRRNRLPYARLRESGTCGHCHSALPGADAPLDVDTDTRFDRLAAASALPVVVDFWATWCGPCRTVAPELEKVARSRAGEWLVVKVDTGALPTLGARFAVRSLPTMALFVGGREAGRTSGARPAAAIESWVRGIVSAAD